jgi:hypothetical protein
LALDANGNLSILLYTAGGEPPPEVYPLTVELCPAEARLIRDKSPTSLALALLANGNLSMVLIARGLPPPEV